MEIKVNTFKTITLRRKHNFNIKHKHLYRKMKFSFKTIAFLYSNFILCPKNHGFLFFKWVSQLFI